MISKSIIDNEKVNSIAFIKEALIKACIHSRPSYFKPYLNSDKVICEPDKEGFYKFFKYMLAISKKTSIGELHFKIKIPDLQIENVQNYEFHDTKHLHPRLTIIIEEFNDSIHIDLLPF